MIHDFIKKLIYQCEIIPHLTFIKFVVEIGFAENDQIIEECNHECGIDVVFGSGDNCDVVVGCVDEGDAIETDDWCFLCCLGSNDLIAKVHYLSSSNIVSEPSIDEDLTLLVYKYNRT